MTENKTTELTPEEQAQIAEENPALLDALKNGGIAAQAWLAHWRCKRSMNDEASTQAEEIRKEVETATQSEQASLAQWCGFPTDMTRCSPFFPMNPKDLGHREYLRDIVITAANWGEIKYTGPQLSTYEEDALIALLAILDNTTHYKSVSEADGSKTYTYKGPALPLLKLLGYARPGKDAYKRLVSALKLLISAVIELSISTGKTKSRKKRAPRYIHLSNMLSGVLWDENKKELSATVNPFFYETYMAGRITLMDVAKRMGLKGAISKALYRFVQSQRNSTVFRGHFLTLADALNINREQPSREVRRLLKTAINELIKNGILKKKSGFIDQDIIQLERALDTFPTKTQKKREIY